MSNTKKVKMSGKTFNAASPGFLYSLITAGLTIFAVSGVSFPKDPAALSGEIVTSLSSGGVYAIIGVLIASVIFPIYNFFKGGGKFSVGDVFSSTLTWVAIGTAALSAVALTGIMVPDGTVQAVIGAVQTKDWMGLISILVINIGNPLIRWLKERNAPTVGA